jgi:hypothetical protein
MGFSFVDRSVDRGKPGMLFNGVHHAREPEIRASTGFGAAQRCISRDSNYPIMGQAVWSLGSGQSPGGTYLFRLSIVSFADVRKMTVLN